MAEPASAVIALIVTGCKTLGVLDDLLKAVDNSSADAQNWAAVSNLLKASCSLMKERLERWQVTSLSPTQEQYLASIRAHLELFQQDLAAIGIPDADAFDGRNLSFKDKAVLALRLKLDQDDRLIKRIDRSIQIFQISASVLSQ